ncbi:hypothetical protein ACSVDE_07465 [Pseudalkalibacillus sp. Hm43]|uniref:hypothetical protein n=1 Tax=Pseudalkalibacillus sp. Hm43 TaxID=3450742 RepID=UPI003F43694A
MKIGEPRRVFVFFQVTDIVDPAAADQGFQLTMLMLLVKYMMSVMKCMDLV